jgi:hypothetical protein
MATGEKILMGIESMTRNRFVDIAQNLRRHSIRATGKRHQNHTAACSDKGGVSGLATEVARCFRRAVFMHERMILIFKFPLKLKYLRFVVQTRAFDLHQFGSGSCVRLALLYPLCCVPCIFSILLDLHLEDHKVML